MVATRYGSSVVLASLVTFGLFSVMSYMVAMGAGDIDDKIKAKTLEMVRVREDQDVTKNERKPERPPEVESPPPDIDLPKTQSLHPGSSSVSFNQAIDGNIDMGGGFGGGMDGEYLPIVKVAPVYPRRAQERGIEGEVVVEFTVTELGTVENPTVVEATPPGYFETAAMNAALKFKYKPKTVNGTAISVSGVRNRITFKLADE